MFDTFVGEDVQIFRHSGCSVVHSFIKDGYCIIWKVIKGATYKSMLPTLGVNMTRWCEQSG